MATGGHPIRTWQDAVYNGATQATSRANMASVGRQWQGGSPRRLLSAALGGNAKHSRAIWRMAIDSTMGARAIFATSQSSRGRLLIIQDSGWLIHTILHQAEYFRARKRGWRGTTVRCRGRWYATSTAQMARQLQEKAIGRPAWRRCFRMRRISKAQYTSRSKLVGPPQGLTCLHTVDEDNHGYQLKGSGLL